MCGRPLLMVCVCLDCYLAVVHPITYRTRKSMTPRVVMAAIVWTLTVAYGLVSMTHPHLYITMLIPAPFIVAIPMIGVCDYFILHTLIKSEQGKKNIHPQKQRALQTLINSLVLTLVSYLPPVLMYIFGLSLISDIQILLCVISIPATITSSLGSAVMPLLYLHNIGKLDRFRCGCCRKT
ncbi:unnamed protein product [Pleuronectes platessa]|uniref:G-protein coupled receptors family 1 profile domain-containing protein n=1 Tax=Pleuronectes platessa TaxID=8262 RepID=A0A9N7V0U6_PLEPL|nr:unnamed protein product [Pleuronectes platessa]